MLPSTVLATMATRIAGHQPTTPMIASTIMTGQMRPATVPKKVSATDGGATRPRDTTTEDGTIEPWTGSGGGAGSDVKGGCCH